jgi:hypothetical protein
LRLLNFGWLRLSMVFIALPGRERTMSDFPMFASQVHSGTSNAFRFLHGLRFLDTFEDHD